MRLGHAQLPFAHLWLAASCREHFLYKTGFLSVVRIIMLCLFNYMACVCFPTPFCPSLPHLPTASPPTTSLYDTAHPTAHISGGWAALCWLHSHAESLACGARKTLPCVKLSWSSPEASLLLCLLVIPQCFQ